MRKDENATMPTPNHTPCRHCGVPISWDEYCWTHDNTGFADCGIIIRGGLRTNEGGLVDALIGGSPNFDPKGDWILDPVVDASASNHRMALPVGDWS